LNKFSTALAQLEDPKNEPIRWLLSDALSQHAATTVGSHFLLQALGRPERSPILATWNAHLHQFRELLRNPDQAPIKAVLDLRCDKKDAVRKLADFFAEVLAVVHLRTLGYSDFSIVLPSKGPMPDFTACFDGQQTAIEVKNLQEPADILRTVAVSHWSELTEAEPERYGFRVILRHQHCPKLPEAAQQRLRNILSQLPDIRNYPHCETLEGGIEIQIERPNDEAELSPEAWMLGRLASDKKSHLTIVTGFSVDDLSPDINDVQALFLKSLRIVAVATPKFFSKSYTPECRNIIALH
jgi:hypothetical protein